MNRTGLWPWICAALLHAGTAARAQDGAAGAAGAGAGFLIGLLIAVVIGALVGWIAGLIVKGGGSGFLGNVLYGIGGSMLANVALPALGITLGPGWIGPLIAAVIGAVALILIVRLIRGAAS